MINLRHYQQDIYNQVVQSVSKEFNPIVQLDTGAGKTPIIAELCRHYENFVVLAHRNFLVRQASETLSKMGVAHDVLASKHTRNLCIVSAQRHNTQLIVSSNKIVASVDTLLSRKKRDRLHFDVDKNWIVIIDEAHHALDDNKWGMLKKLLPFSQFIGVTATPVRMDGRSLNSLDGGLFDTIIQAEELKENSVATLIQNGYLSGFRCYKTYMPKGVNKTDYDYTDDDPEKLFEDKYILGEYVKYYKRLAKNKRAIVMCRSINEAELVAETFKEAGCAAMCISSKMTPAAVTRIIDDFKNGIVKILCNVAMVDEGFDVPDAECLIMLRTVNFRTYRQWVGRVLRPKKNPAIIIDHADNLTRHGLPDAPVDWVLYRDKYYQHHLVDCIKCGFVFHYKKLKCQECGQEINLNAEERRVKEDNSRYRKTMIGVLRRFMHEHTLAIHAQKMKESYKHRLEIPHIDGHGVMVSAIKNLAKWFANNMEIHVNRKIVSYELVNEFMKNNFNSHDFWLKNFTVNDTKKQNLSKCLDVYKKYGGKLL